MERLNEQIDWYGRSSARNRRRYHWGRNIQIMLAVCVILAALLEAPTFLTALLGLLLLGAQALERFSSFHENWLAHQFACEELKHEKYLYDEGAGPYSDERESDRILAERMEGIVPSQLERWVSWTEQGVQKQERR